MKWQTKADTGLTDICRQAIAIDSTPEIGSGPIVDFFSQYAKNLGFEVEIQNEVSNGLEEGNIVVRFPGSAEAPVILMMQSHLDTPDPGSYSHWAHTDENPFKASIYNNKIYGLGSAEGKLDFICKLLAMKKFIGKKQASSVCAVGTFGANSGMSGALKFFRRKKMQPENILIGSPTEMKLAASCPGVAVIEVRIPFSKSEMDYRTNHNTSVSSSSQSKFFKKKNGNNPVEDMLSYIAQLPDGVSLIEADGGVDPFLLPDSAWVEFEMSGSIEDTIVPKLVRFHKELQNAQKEMGSQFLNLGVLRTQEGSLTLTMTCNLLASNSDEFYRQKIETVRSVCLEIGAGFQLKEYKSAFKADQNSEFFRSLQECAKSVDLPSEPGEFPVCSEANLFGRVSKNCYMFGAGQLFVGHNRHEEHVSIPDLEKACAFYEKVIEAVTQ